MTDEFYRIIDDLPAISAVKLYLQRHLANLAVFERECMAYFLQREKVARSNQTDEKLARIEERYATGAVASDDGLGAVFCYHFEHRAKLKTASQYPKRYFPYSKMQNISLMSYPSILPTTHTGIVLTSLLIGPLSRR